MSFGDSKKIIGSAKVDFGKDLFFAEGKKKVRNWRNSVSILFPNLVESGIVNTKTMIFVGFWYEKNRKALRRRSRANESP